MGESIRGFDSRPRLVSSLGPSSMKVSSHSRFEDLRLRLRGTPQLLQRWSCAAYRVTTLDYPRPRSILLGQGSFLTVAAGTPCIYHPAIKLAEPPAIEKIAEKFGLRQETLSRMTGFSLRAVAGWSNGKTPSAPVRRALVEMDRLLDSLSRLMKPKDVGHWLKQPNPALDGSTPVQVIERGQADRSGVCFISSNQANRAKVSHFLSVGTEADCGEAAARSKPAAGSIKSRSADAQTVHRCEHSEACMRITSYE